MTRRSILRSLTPLLSGFFLLLVAGAMSLIITHRQEENADRARLTLGIANQLNDIQALATDAETGQRGYLLTGRLDYLDPYATAKRAIGGALAALETKVKSAGSDPQSIERLRTLSADKFAELQRTIDLRAAGHKDDALLVVNIDTGKRLMDAIRAEIVGLRNQQTALLDQRTIDAGRLDQIDQAVVLTSLLLVLGFGAFAVIDARRRMLSLQDVNTKLLVEANERKAAEAQLRQLQKMEAVGQLTGGIAHDFNNMLAIVTGFLDLGRRRLANDDKAAVRDCIDRASEGADRAVVLTRRLLAFSRQHPLEPRVIDANGLVSGMSELLRRSLGEDVGIETILSGGLWKTRADPAQLENALLNLAINARDAMPKGGKLTIETANSDLDDRYAAAHSEVKAGQYILVSVTDTGTGMPQATIERAFDPFFTTKAVGKGTGLGLSQVFGFVKQSGGHVKIYSELSHGTSVKIYLPRHHGPIDAHNAAGPEERLIGGRTTEVILVVEDEARVRRMTVESLRELGYTVVHAALPSEALSQLDAHASISLMLTDIVMPEMSGRDLAERALSRHPALKVVYTTGYTRNAVVHNGIVDPGTAFLPKPFTLTQLGGKIRQTLDGVGG